jgi:hypothetical protein
VQNQLNTQAQGQQPQPVANQQAAASQTPQNPLQAAAAQQQQSEQTPPLIGGSGLQAGSGSQDWQSLLGLNAAPAQQDQSQPFVWPTSRSMQGPGSGPAAAAAEAQRQQFLAATPTQATAPGTLEGIRVLKEAAASGSENLPVNPSLRGSGQEFGVTDQPTVGRSPQTPNDTLQWLARVMSGDPTVFQR